MIKNKIFISHSSKDILVVESFVENILKLGLDIPSDRIFCTSMEGHGVKSGQYIPDRLREEIHLASLALLFISNNYKASEVCLNEVGAAWATLNKEKVIPILLPDVNFNELGFLDLGRLGLKIHDKFDMLKLIEDCKEILNPNFNISKLSNKVEIFISDIELSNLHETPSSMSTEPPDQYSDRFECFDENLSPFDDILRQSIPTFNDGIHEIKDTKLQNKILSKLSEFEFLNRLWYKKAEGDSYVERLIKTPSGNWLVSLCNWEIKVSTMWISINVENQYEFILIRTEELEPYKIDSDIGGVDYNVGKLKDGTIVSENERLNGHAIIGEETIDLCKYGIEPRIRDRESHWIFFVTDHHKAGYNADETIEFCEKLDKGIIEVNATNIKRFLRPLKNHPTIIKWR